MTCHHYLSSLSKNEHLPVDTKEPFLSIHTHMLRHCRRRAGRLQISSSFIILVGRRRAYKSTCEYKRYSIVCVCVWLPWENEAKNHQENKIFPPPIKKDFLCQFAQMLAISDDSEVTREFRSMHHKTMLLPTNAFSLIYQILQNWLAVIGSYTSKQYDHLHFDASKNRKIYTGWYDGGFDWHTIVPFNK